MLSWNCSAEVITGYMPSSLARWMVLIVGGSAVLTVCVLWWSPTKSLMDHIIHHTYYHDQAAQQYNTVQHSCCPHKCKPVKHAFHLWYLDFARSKIVITEHLELQQQTQKKRNNCRGNLLFRVRLFKKKPERQKKTEKRKQETKCLRWV